MDYSNMLNLLVQILLIAGAINWALVAYNGTDLVNLITGGGDFAKYVKYTVGAAGVYHAYTLYA
jgi:uncharacterized membrane protein YuzA (DUF378 family)